MQLHAPLLQREVGRCFCIRWRLLSSQPAAAPLDWGEAGGDCEDETGTAAGDKPGDKPGEGDEAGDGEADGERDAEGLTAGGLLGVNSTKPVGEGTMSAAAADCAELRGGARPLALTGLPPGLRGSAGGWTGTNTDWIDARVGDRPTAKGDGSLGRGTDAGPRVRSPRGWQARHWAASSVPEKEARRAVMRPGAGSDPAQRSPSQQVLWAVRTLLGLSREPRPALVLRERASCQGPARPELLPQWR